MEAGRNYVICATHRSGSNLLGDLLRSTRHAGDPQELLSPRLMSKFAELHGANVIPEQQVVKYFRTVEERLRGANGVFGIKIMWSHLEPTEKLLQSDSDYLGSTEQGIKPMLDWLLPGAKFVWISRQDKLRQAISMVRAKLTDVFTARQQLEGLNKLLRLPDYDYAAIKAELKRVSARDAAWGNFFPTCDIQPLHILYEELCAAPQKELERVMHYLGLETGVFDPSTLRERQADALNDQWYVRFNEDQLAEQLKANEKPEPKRSWWRG